MYKFVFLVLGGIGLLFGYSGHDARCWGASPAGQPAVKEQLRPRWQVGQRWVVETTKKIVHASHDPAAARPIRWQFTVTRREWVGGQECFRVEIACRNIEGVPGMTIWVDAQTLALRQVETGLLVQGEIRRVRERYEADDVTGSPVVGLPSSLPLDLPVFAAGSSSSGRFGYQAVMVDDDDRHTADLAFAVAVEQDVKPAGRAEVLRLIGDDSRIGRKARPAFDVRLRSHGREVRQLWQAGLPWPSFSASDGSTSRLVEVADVVPVATTTVASPARRAPVVRRVATGRQSSMNVAGVDEGQSRFMPWSGSWFPARKGGLLRQLGKYDQLTGKQSASWERRAKDPRSSVPWAGYCHAWAAASVMEREPRAPRTVTGTTGESLVLGVGDQKALLTICHDQDESEHYGERYNGAGDDPQDIYPDVLWRCLRLYVKQRGIPLILDIDPGSAIWNYPVYRYRVTHRPHTAGLRIATMEIWMADDKVPADFVGTKVKKKTYQFTFRMNGKALVMGSARWYGASRKDHPDFAWYPTIVRPKNPHVSPAVVRRMLGFKNPSVAMRPAPERVADMRELGERRKGVRTLFPSHIAVLDMPALWQPLRPVYPAQRRE